MATAFAGYYLALMLILWGLILRGVSIEVRGHINDPLWQGFWDFIFAFANFCSPSFSAPPRATRYEASAGCPRQLLDGLFHRFHGTRQCWFA
jgi:hypothetical protein